jgi:hypothetical protein
VQRLLEVAHEPAPVAEAREGVREGLDAGVGELVRFAKNVMPKRPITARSEAHASATASRLSRSK